MRHRDAGALERLRRLAVVVARRPVDELEDVLRDAEVRQHRADHPLDRRERAEAVEDRRRDEAEHPRVDAHRHLRRMARAREDVEHLADPVRRRIGQVEALAVESLLVREVVERVGDEVDRHDVDAAALDADRRHPRRQRAPELLQRLEEIVRPVDLVDVAGLRVADDEAGPVDPERHLAVLADDAFGIVLGPEIRMVEVLGLLEHVLAEHAVVEPGGGDRAHVVEAAGADGRGECDGVARALDVRALLLLRARREIVDRGQMEDVLHASLELAEVRGRHPEVWLREIADDADDLAVGRAPVLRAQLVELRQRALAHEDVDRLAALQQVRDEEATDEPGRAGDEVRHMAPPWEFPAGSAAARGVGSRASTAGMSARFGFRSIISPAPVPRRGAARRVRRAGFSMIALRSALELHVGR